VTDDRYAVPSMMLVQTKDEKRARSLAAGLLREKHHHAVEVWSGERLLFSLAEEEPA
jgi:hypothetical protein